MAQAFKDKLLSIALHMRKSMNSLVRQYLRTDFSGYSHAIADER